MTKWLIKWLAKWFINLPLLLLRHLSGFPVSRCDKWRTKDLPGSHGLNDWLGDWLNDWLIDFLNDWFIYRLLLYGIRLVPLFHDDVNDRLTRCLFNNWLLHYDDNDWLNDWVNDWFIYCLLLNFTRLISLFLDVLNE